jgi:hypothetical protein
MRATIPRRLVAIAVTALSAVTLLATLAAAALATVPGGLVDDQGQNIGRGGGFVVTIPSDWSALAVIGGLAISAAVVAFVAWLGIRSDNSARRGLRLAPSGVSAGGESAPEADQERRKAA